MSEERDPKHYVVQALREALASDDRVNELHIRVTVTGDKVFIGGSVATAQRHDAVSQVASEVLPDYEIHNETKVHSPAGAPEVEELT